MHEVLVNRLGGLSLPRKSVVRLTDRPDMTLDVYRGRKTTIQYNTIHLPLESTHLCQGFFGSQTPSWTTALLSWHSDILWFHSKPASHTYSSFVSGTASGLSLKYVEQLHGSNTMWLEAFSSSTLQPTEITGYSSIQSNFNGSNTFGTIKISSRKG